MNLKYAGAAILFIIMITLLYLLWRREHPRGGDGVGVRGGEFGAGVGGGQSGGVVAWDALDLGGTEREE